MTAIYVFIGGGLGSLARFGVSKLTFHWMQISFPLGTFISNIAACILLGLIIYILPVKAESSWMHPLMIIGFCGGFSTFSTFSAENAMLFNNGDYWLAIANIFISIAAGIGIILMMKLKAS